MPPETPASTYRMPCFASSAWRRTSSWKFVLPPSTIVSPASRCSTSSAICASVASPAGTMIHVTRGFSSFATSSATVLAATRSWPAPCSSWASSTAFSTVRL